MLVTTVADCRLVLQVIRALYDYEARSSQELSFSRGDFFHVIDREDDPDWYEACNPALPDTRGLVPVVFFKVAVVVNRVQVYWLQ